MQHTPSRPTATPVPLHTPHASSCNLGQHVPLWSMEAPGEQHRPDTASMYPSQHLPATSTTPPSHSLWFLPVPSSRGTLHPSPPHPVAHTHWADVVLHTVCMDVQSASR